MRRVLCSILISLVLVLSLTQDASAKGAIGSFGNDEWIIIEGESIETMSVYSDTRTNSKVFYITRLGYNTPAIQVTQSVTFVVNDESQTVSIVSYSTSCNALLNGISISVMDPDRYANGGTVASGGSAYNVVSSLHGFSNVIATSVIVTRTGTVSFDIRAL